VPAADSVIRVIQVASEVPKTLLLDQLHALAVQSFNRLVDYGLVRELVRESEAGAPVAEVTRDHEHGLFVEEQRQQELGIPSVLVLGNVTHHQGDKSQGVGLASISEDLLDVRNVHF